MQEAPINGAFRMAMPWHLGLQIRSFNEPIRLGIANHRPLCPARSLWQFDL